MSNRSPSNSTWIVVEVRSGIPNDVKAFCTQDKAIEYLEALRESLNLNNDEAEIFEVSISSE